MMMMIESLSSAAPARAARASAIRVSICILIPAAAALVVHYPVLDAKALCFDDSEYLVGNPLVKNPSLNSAARFFGEVWRPSTIRGYYQPLSMVSLMLDYATASSENDLRPFHRTNLILHVLCTALVALIIWQLFADATVALMAGLLFGLHPLAVESVAWIGQRKTLLAAFFCFASLSCYVRYAHRGNLGSLIATGLLFVLALLSKPTSTPLPIVMLLLDGWPLNRISRRAFVEKIPLVCLSVVAAIVTYISQRDTAGVATPDQSTWEQTLLTLFYAPAFYLKLIFCPANLSAYYPFPTPYSFSNAAVSIMAGACLGILVAVVTSLRKTRSIFVAGLIFFVLLLPTLGIIGFAEVVAADRFAYLPILGVLLILAWVFLAMPRRARVIACGVVVLIAMTESVLARGQLAHWATTESLAAHMLKAAPNSSAVWGNQAFALQEVGKNDDAVAAYHHALDLAPNNVIAMNNLAVLVEKMGRRDEAVALLQRALIARPEHAWTHFHLANLLVRDQRLAEAAEHYRSALRANPDLPEVHYNLAVALVMMNRVDESIAECNAALAIRPDADVHCLLGTLLGESGQSAAAMEHFRAALAIDPEHARTLAAIEAAGHKSGAR
jgi:Flp pilus assembly protein TadD